MPTKKIIPFYRPSFDKLETKKISDILQSGWVNTGKETKKFEQEISSYVGALEIHCTSSCSASLIACLKNLGIGKGDEVITVALSFVATANVIVQCGAKPIFVDTDGTHIDPREVSRKISNKTKAIIAVDFAGYPAQHEQLLKMCNDYHHLAKSQPLIKGKIKKHTPSLQSKMARPILILDAAHSIGTNKVKKEKSTTTAKQKTLPLSVDLACYSFHTAKNITTVEGGAIGVFNKKLTKDQLKNTPTHQFQNWLHHGMDRNAHIRQKKNLPIYDVINTGFKFNMTDMEASMGRVQLSKIEKFREKRQKILHWYQSELDNQQRKLEDQCRQLKVSPTNFFFQSKLIKEKKAHAKIKKLFPLENEEPSINPVDSKNGDNLHEKTHLKKNLLKNKQARLPSEEKKADHSNSLSNQSDCQIIKLIRPLTTCKSSEQWKVFPHLALACLDFIPSLKQEKDEISKRNALTNALRIKYRFLSSCKESGINLNQHYIPISEFQFYKNNFPISKPISHLPNTYDYYSSSFSLPFYNQLTKNDVRYVIEKILKIAIDIKKQWDCL